MVDSIHNSQGYNEYKCHLVADAVWQKRFSIKYLQSRHFDRRKGTMEIRREPSYPSTYIYNFFSGHPTLRNYALAVEPHLMCLSVETNQIHLIGCPSIVIISPLSPNPPITQKGLLIPNKLHYPNSRLSHVLLPLPLTVTLFR